VFLNLLAATATEIPERRGDRGGDTNGEAALSAAAAAAISAISSEDGANCRCQKGQQTRRIVKKPNFHMETRHDFSAQSWSNLTTYLISKKHARIVFISYFWGEGLAKPADVPKKRAARAFSIARIRQDPDRHRVPSWSVSKPNEDTTNESTHKNKT
jgi:hypothetical protein